MSFVPVVQTVLADGRIQLSGGTYPLREAIRAHGGRWNAEERVWTLPAGTDTSFIPTGPPPAAPKPKVPKPKTAPAPVKPREEWTLEEWRAHVRANSRRGYIGPCCSHAVGFEEYWQGPIHYRCERHGITRSSYSGT
jgi:hypothetical protein